ncbi:hypothetical protein Sango_2507800 [Sesamum angolense]|uniref:Gag1-like clamp domain-containing protein n=1 Tax=Sesamum angolense TaxID=2727404 RepID=A0AAE2BI83_9LAMI|nr:hypothetical protein Sango_2507800 [Sesamum angolense]
MEGICSSHLFDNHSSRGSESVNVENMATVQDDCSSLFINYAAIAWHEMRRAWRGDQSVASQRKPREPIMRHVAMSFAISISFILFLACGVRDATARSTSYQDVVSSGERFNEPVPLATVKFHAKPLKDGVCLMVLNGDSVL